MSRVLDIEDANVVGARDYSAVIRVGHELDGENVRPVARDDGGCQAELFCVGTGLYEWMLMRWSSEPEARRRPDRDQLAEAHQYLLKLQGSCHIP